MRSLIAYAILAGGFIAGHFLDSDGQGWVFAAGGAFFCCAILLQGFKKEKENGKNDEC